MSHPVSPQHGFPADGFTQRLLTVIRFAVRGLAVLMAFVILMGVIDVVWVLYQRLMAPPFLLLEIRDILGTFGAFMAVLIAIEIFVNITIYLRDDVIHIKIVMATALMAIARKVIIMDMQESTPAEMYGLAAVTLAMSVGYWLVVGNPFGGRGDPEVSQAAPPLPSPGTRLPTED
ncbi:MAG: phosphate-starvation-inducible PsiE family protein [Phycisphaerae bacterium]|nr:phosphate-starvation-inducible PsiE family protein [Phycisphaerae bacterium]